MPRSRAASGPARPCACRGATAKFFRQIFSKSKDLVLSQKNLCFFPPISPVFQLPISFYRYFFFFFFFFFVQLRGPIIVDQVHPSSSLFYTTTTIFFFYTTSIFFFFSSPPPSSFSTPPPPPPPPLSTSNGKGKGIAVVCL